ncbi:Uma2 family endonuclease [Pseudanabaenaceae cyanobacterium LEGE 13415]|nr:Uma2 family endonuclease [Pseudanabaenaceae cyanobacterium LEGE 13415]
MIQLLTKSVEQRLIHHGHTWEQFKLIQKGFEGFPGVRLFYYEGTIEILMPGRDHEFFSRIIAMLLHVFFEEIGVEFAPTGSMDQEREGIVSAQADESYCIGDLKPLPDLSIEVIFTSGGPSKLARYQALGIPEVWFWQDGLFTLYHLRENGYERIEQSELPHLDRLNFDVLTQCVLMAQTSRLEAIRTMRAAVKSQTN